MIDIEHVAKLARIKLDEKEKEKFFKDLGAVLNYVDQLNEVDTKNIEPLYQVTGVVNQYRSDDKRQNDMKRGEDNPNLVGQAPETKDGFVKVKAILKK